MGDHLPRMNTALLFLSSYWIYRRATSYFSRNWTLYEYEGDRAVALTAYPTAFRCAYLSYGYGFVVYAD